MNYSEALSASVEFIERHLQDELTPESIADYAGYSVFHFCRVFASVYGVPLMDYVRARRLSRARAELLLGRKVIDAALDYGFETASGFSKAFRKAYGYSPTTYIARMSGWGEADSINQIGGFIMHPIIKKMNAFKVAGYGIKTDITSGYMKDIAAYWDNYTGENLETKMYEQLKPPKHGEVGLCVANESGDVVYLLGVVVEDFNRVTPDMLTVTVPAAEYAVFTTPPVDTRESATYAAGTFSASIRALWKYIFEEWFPQSGYEYDDSKMDFEYYDERCHHSIDSVMEIYIPVKKK